MRHVPRAAPRDHFGDLDVLGLTVDREGQLSVLGFPQRLLPLLFLRSDLLDRLSDLERNELRAGDVLRVLEPVLRDRLLDGDVYKLSHTGQNKSE